MKRLVSWAGRHPWWWLLAYLVVTGALYQTAARWPLYAPILVHPSTLDEAIPIVGWTAAPYLTYFALMPSFVFLSRGHPARGALLVTAGLGVVGNLLINTLVPTALAQPLTPDGAGGGLLAMVVAGDAPGAVLPSGHVALPVALSVLALRHRLHARWIYPPWAIVMAIVTLTTKQHVVLDVAAGLVWGILAPICFERVVGLQRASELDRGLASRAS